MTWVINLIINHYSKNIYRNWSFSKKRNTSQISFSNSDSLSLRGSTWHGRQESLGCNSWCQSLAFEIRKSFILHRGHCFLWNSSWLNFCTELLEILIRDPLFLAWRLLLFFREFCITLLHWSHVLLGRLLNLLAFCTLYLSQRLAGWFGTYPLWVKTSCGSIQCWLDCRLFSWAWRSRLCRLPISIPENALFRRL